MSQRSQEIIKRIQKASKLAGDSKADLDRNQVEAERQKVMKTFKEFVEAVTPSRFVPGESNYGDPGYQERLTKERQKEKEKKEQKAKKLKTDLHIQRTRGLGILGNYKDHGWGYMKTDPKTGKKTFTPKDN